MDLSKLQNGSDVRGVALAGVENEPVTLDDAAVRAIAGGFARFRLRAARKRELPRERRARLASFGRGDRRKRFAKRLRPCGAEVTDLGLCHHPGDVHDDRDGGETL